MNPERSFRERKVIGTAVLTERRKQQPDRSFVLIDRRVFELTALAKHRGRDGDARWVRPLVEHFARRKQVSGDDYFPEDLADQIQSIAPWLADRRLEIVATAALAVKDPVRWTARRLGDAVRLTATERKVLGIKTIRYEGQTRAMQAEAKRKRDRERQAERRAATSISREQYVRLSIAEEARQLGISRKTLYKRKKAMEEGNRSLADIDYTYICDGPVTPAFEPNGRWLAEVIADPNRRMHVANVFAKAAALLSPRQKAA